MLCLERKALLREPLISIEKIGESDPVPFRSAGQPLAVVRCLQATKVIAGTVVGRTLAEHGADVLHIAGPQEEGHFLNWYRWDMPGWRA